MKKLLLVLLVVTLASFLLVGCIPTVPVAVTGVTLDQATMALTAGGATGTLVETVVPADATNKTVTWSSSAPAVATVANGVVTPLTAATTTITVTTVDGSLTATCEVTVEAAVIPVAPTITAIPDQVVYWDEDGWTYQVAVTLGTGTTLTYSLIGAPVSMGISSTGLITWTTILDVIALPEVTVKVLANDGLFDEETFIVEVREPLPIPVGPTVDSLLPLDAIVDEAYVGQVTATAGDNATLTYSLIGAPGDMAISATGEITWTPVADGDQVVTVEVTDGAALSDSKDFTIVVAPRVAPTLADIANQIAYYGEAFTYQVVATAGTDPVLTFSLPDKPTMMTIDATTGIISWTPIAAQLGYNEVTVKVTAADDLFAEETFIIEVQEPEALVIDIDIPDAYIHPTKGPIVAEDCYDIVVTFSNNSITEGQDVWARWSDVTGGVNGSWEPLTGNADDTEFTGEICFNEPVGVVTECDLICIEVKVGTICCDPIIYSENIIVDSIAPCASFTVAIVDCDEDVCDPDAPGASMTFSTTCEDICDVPFDCCGDECSGVGDWKFVLDDDVCDGPCDTEGDIGCPITGAFECGCLLYDGEEGSDGVHVIDVSIKDNVGNEFTDTWTLTFDTDSLVSFASGSITPHDNGDGTWSLDYGCTWDDCEECFPEVE